jgi:hypothetical protein
VIVGADDFTVELRETPQGWRVVIVETGGEVLSERACRDGAEARAYASTVRQHVYWLSPERFRTYYAPEG